ncbi:hypothetical protein MLD38_031192 [Melastoma candidum]|uniref:Uncharacterized protein n=1 Tax=Melastoma candidum TaxID=119954 RepID=A0ACB9MNA9_9MYRT|nr:hypothetical protein MLD38_031192 [Melastoma candidum]
MGHATCPIGGLPSLGERHDVQHLSRGKRNRLERRSPFRFPRSAALVASSLIFVVAAGRTAKSTRKRGSEEVGRAPRRRAKPLVQRARSCLLQRYERKDTRGEDYPISQWMTTRLPDNSPVEEPLAFFKANPERNRLTKGDNYCLWGVNMDIEPKLPFVAEVCLRYCHDNAIGLHVPASLVILTNKEPCSAKLHADTNSPTVITS